MQSWDNTTINDFIIEQKAIGEGSFGKVYRASLKGDPNSLFAVKYIDKRGKTKKDIDGFKCQTQIMKKLQHPNIINLKCVFETSQNLIIVMEYAQTDFSKLMKERVKLPIEEVKKYGYQILEALLYLKQHKVIHRDLKPQNILFHNGHIKLCDFGFAKQMNASNAFVYSLKGTPLYIAPQISKQKPYNFKADVWAFGVILFELFVGKQPFYATTWHRLIPKIQNNPVTFPESMPKQLRSLINGMLHKDANSRFDYQNIKTHLFFENAQQQYKIGLKSQTPGNEDAPRFENSQVKIVFSDISNKPQCVSIDQKQKPQKHEKPQEELRQLVKDIEHAASQILDGKQSSLEFALRKKTDQEFGLKLLSLFQIKIKKQLPVQKETLIKVFKILSFMISKVKIQKIDGQCEDITKNLAVAYSVIKIAENQDDFQLLQQEITLLGLIIKNNFDSLQVDMDTEDKVRFLIVKLLEKSRLKQLQVNDITQSLIPKKIIINGLKILGILANQGLLTLENSIQFFENCQQSHLLKTIAECYQPNPEYFVILDLLQKFVHPTLQLKNQQQFFSHEKQLLFKKMKEQVAETLVIRNFIHPKKSPFQIYTNVNEIECYFQILYECMKVSKSMRDKYQSHQNYWLDMLGRKRLQAFALANNDLLMKFQTGQYYSNSIMRSIDIQQQKDGQRQLIKLLLVKNAFFNYTRKPDSTMKSESGMMILNQALQLLKTEETAKFKCIKYLQGSFLSNKYSLFDEQLINMICLITEKEFEQSTSQQGLLQILETCYYNMKLQSNTVERDIFRLSQQRTYQFLTLISRCKAFDTLQETFQKKVHNSFIELVNTDHIRDIESKYGKQFGINYFLRLYEFLKPSPIFNSSVPNRGTSQQQAYQKIIQKCLQANIHTFLFENFELLLKKGFYEKQQKIIFSVQFLTKMMSSASKNQKSLIVDFVGFQVLPHFSNFIRNNRKFSAQLLLEIVSLISFLTKCKPDFDEIIFDIGIISNVTGLLLQKFHNIANASFKQACIDKTLNMIGNLTKNKKPVKFFDKFRQHRVLYAVRKTMEEYSANKKILKNGIFAIGNISFWNDSFVQEVIPILYVFRQLLVEGNNNEDEHLINNLISTLSNLVRHSPAYLDALLKYQVIYSVLNIYMIQNKLETKRNHDQFKFAWNFIKKCLNVGNAFDQSTDKFRIMKDVEFYKLSKQLVQFKKDASALKDGGSQFKKLCQLFKM